MEVVVVAKAELHPGGAGGQPTVGRGEGMVLAMSCPEATKNAGRNPEVKRTVPLMPGMPFRSILTVRMLCFFQHV